MIRNIILLFLVSIVVRTIQYSCDIVIAGGTLAALGAVLQAPLSLKICLIQPTDRLGGQLGDEGVWHIDFNWLYQPGYPDKTVAYNHANLHNFFKKITDKCNTGDCWVSRNCFMYSCIQPIINQYLQPRIYNGNLFIFYNSTIKNVQKLGNTIKSISVLQRKQKKIDCRNANVRIKDWYTSDNSQYYNKTIIKFNVNKYIIQATQYGDILVLADAQYMQGTNLSNKCGQSIVFGLHQLYDNQTNIKKNEDIGELYTDDFSLAGYTTDSIWRYRRLMGNGLHPRQGQLTLQNWNGPGNDYRYGYLFLNENEFSKQDWRGGINFTTIEQAQARSLRFHQWFKDQSNLPLKLTGEYFKTCSGTSRLPYIRDGRRSVGYKGFMINQGDVTGTFIPEKKLTATPFEDRIALGFYNMDIHSIKDCVYDSFPNTIPLPFYLPARAFTNRKISNLIVAGRAMAQQFYTSSATRTHTTQFNSGVSSILMATYLISRKQSSVWSLIDCPQCITQFQTIIRQIMPIQWTINGQKYPKNKQLVIQIQNQ